MGSLAQAAEARVLLHQRGHRHDHVRSVPVHAAAGVCRRHRPAHVRHAGACGGPHPQQALGLGERYEFWLRELVRINEEEAARAGRPPLPLWDFSDPNTITRRTGSSRPATLTPMRWFWEHSHYRKITGDLVLDRVFGTTRAGARRCRADFGVPADRGQYRRAYRARQNPSLRAWAAANSDLVVADRAGGANLDDAQPPGRGDLLVTSGSFRSRLRGDAGACVDAHGALGYGPPSHLHAKTRHTDAITICPCYVCSVALSPVPPNAGELRQAGETSG